MQIYRALSAAAVLSAATVVAACASTDYHFSQLSGSRYYQTPLDTYPVSILRVDDQNVLNGTVGPVYADRATPYPRKFALVDAGRRQITVQGPPGGAGSTGELKTVELDIAPCTRYFLVAVKDNRLASDFTVKVDYQEPVSGCTPA